MPSSQRRQWNLFSRSRHLLLLKSKFTKRNLSTAFVRITFRRSLTNSSDCENPEKCGFQLAFINSSVAHKAEKRFLIPFNSIKNVKRVIHHLYWFFFHKTLKKIHKFTSKIKFWMFSQLNLKQSCAAS